MLCVLRLVKAWPHDLLLHPFCSSASPAKGLTGHQFGSKVVQAWPEHRLKRQLLEKRGTSPKPCYLQGFRTVWVDLGRHWAAPGCLWRSHRRLRTPLCQYRGTGLQLGVGNGRKRAETDANGRKWMQTNPNSSRIRGQNLSKGQNV